MKLNENDVELFIKAVEENNMFSAWRKGQCLFNALNRTFPKMANEIRGTDADPFYVDEKIGLFLDTIMDEDATQIWYQHLVSLKFK